MRRFLRENGLSIIWLGLFFVTLIFGQSVAGHRHYNEEQREHGWPEGTYVEYVAGAHFVEATMENWESEFLQMFLFIVLTVFLYQKGSAESKKIDEEEEVDRNPRQSKHKGDAPWPVCMGGLVLRLYENSLVSPSSCSSLAAFSSTRAAARWNTTRTKPSTTRPSASLLSSTWGTSRFWFESLQNWQSEFLAVGLMVALSI